MQMTMKQACNKVYQDHKDKPEPELWILSKCLFVINGHSTYTNETRRKILKEMEDWIEENGSPLLANLQRWINLQDDKEVITWIMMEEPK